MKKASKNHRSRPNQKLRVAMNKKKRHCDLEYQKDLRFKRHLAKIGISPLVYFQLMKQGIMVTSKKMWERMKRGVTSP